MLKKKPKIERSNPLFALMRKSFLLFLVVPKPLGGSSTISGSLCGFGGGAFFRILEVVRAILGAYLSWYNLRGTSLRPLICAGFPVVA